VHLDVAIPVIIRLSVLSSLGAGGRPGIGGEFELRSVFLFKCPAPGKSSWVKKVQIPHTRVIVVGQKNSTPYHGLVTLNHPPMPGLPPSGLTLIGA